MVELKLNQIRHTSGIELYSQIRDGERVYILSDKVVKQIIIQYMETIDKLELKIREQNNKTGDKNESYRASGQPDKTGGLGYGD